MVIPEGENGTEFKEFDLPIAVMQTPVRCAGSRGSWSAVWQRRGCSTLSCDLRPSFTPPGA